MKRHIHLATTTAETPRHSDYPFTLLTSARQKLAKQGLRFDNKTGIIRNNEGIVEQFSTPSDHVPAGSEDEVMRWQFQRHIFNEAYRLKKGLK